MATGLKRLNDPSPAQSIGAVGNIMSPLVHIPFKRQDDEKALSGIQTFTRASTATYIDALDGLVKTAAIDTPRFERMSDGGTGVLLEGASTNLYFGSQLASSFRYGSYLRSDNTTIAPDGTLTGGTITANAPSTYNINTVNTGSALAGRTITASVWVKASVAADVGKSCTLWLYTDPSINIHSTNQVLSLDWQRIFVTFTGIASDTTNTISFRLDSRNTNSLVGESLDVWGMQLEELPFASSYIPTTTTTVTRTADNLSIPMSGNIPSHYLPHTILFDINIKGSILPYSDFIKMYIYNGITSFNMFRIENQTLVAYHGSGSPLMAYMPNGKTNRACKVVDGVSVRGFIDGTIAGTQIGSLIDNPANNITISGAYAYIRNFRIYDKALTAAEIALA